MDTTGTADPPRLVSTAGGERMEPRQNGTATRLLPPGRGSSGGILADRAGALERLEEVGRKRRLDRQGLSRERMLEGEPRRVEELAS